MNIHLFKTFEIQKGGPKREVHCNTILSQKIRKISNIQANLTLKGTRDRTTNKAYSKKEKRKNKD